MYGKILPNIYWTEPVEVSMMKPPNIHKYGAIDWYETCEPVVVEDMVRWFDLKTELDFCEQLSWYRCIYTNKWIWWYKYFNEFAQNTWIKYST